MLNAMRSHIMRMINDDEKKRAVTNKKEQENSRNQKKGSCEENSRLEIQLQNREI